MPDMRRRSFLATPALAGLAVPAGASSSDSRVIATGDGLPLSPEEYASVLQKVAPGVKVDNYSLGGVVETLEAKVAAALGKESAVWLPTGTMANQLAVRILAGEKRRVLVQQECHLYNDCGDCCQTLSNLNLVPLAPGKATFTLEDVQREAERGAGGRVAVPIGAIQIESPVRRKTGEVFDFAEAKKIAAWARANGVGMHLDGARLYLSAAYNGVSAREYAAPFDTVFVSMSKYFNAASGAMLAGPKSLLENLFHSRRMFGGGLPHSWPFAAVAMHYFEGFPERFSQAVATSERVIAALQSDKRFAVERVPNGSNIFFVQVKGSNAEAFRERARSAGLMLGAPVKDKFTVQVNETWNRAKSDEIIARFRG
jgi:threonine aldolase